MTNSHTLETALPSLGCSALEDILYALHTDDLNLFLNRHERLLLLINAEVDANDFKGSLTIPELISSCLFDCGYECMSDLDFKRSMLVLATHTNSQVILKHLLEHCIIPDEFLRKLLIVAIRQSAVSSLDILISRLDKPNQLIDGISDNVLTLALKEGNLQMAEYIISKHNCDFILEISVSQADSFSYENHCSFLSQIIGSNHGMESLKLMCVMYAVAHGCDILGDVRSKYMKPIEAGFQFSPMVSICLVQLFMEFEIDFDLNHLLWLCIESKYMSLKQKKILIELISSKIDLECTLLEDEDLNLEVKKILG